MSNPYGGVFAIWANDRVYDYDYVVGGQVVFDWRGLHTGVGSYNWSNLDAEMDAFAATGRKFTVQVNGSRKPDFLFNNVPYHPSQLANQVKDPQGTLAYWHSYHVARYNEFLVAFCAHLEAYPNKQYIIGVRTNYCLLGTEHTLSSSKMPAQGTWTIPSGVSWEPLNNNGLKDNIDSIWRANLNTIKRLLRNGKPDDYAVVDQTAMDNGEAAPYQTGCEEQPFWNGNGPEWRFGPLIKWGRGGFTTSYSESHASSNGKRGSGSNIEYNHRWSTFEQWMWWRSLFELHLGTTFVAFYGRDLDEAQSNADYRTALEFVNKYAGFHDKPTESPGAFIAFREGYKGYYANHNPDWDMRKDYTFLVDTFVSDYNNFPSLSRETFDPDGYGKNNGTYAPNYVDPNSGELGNQNQRFGAWARKLKAGQNVDIAFNQAFVNSSGADRTVKTIYLSRGNGTLTISAFGLTRTINVGNSGQWITDVWAADGGNDVATVNLAASGGDVTLHMIEIEREAGTDTGGGGGGTGGGGEPPPPGEITHVNNGAAITPNLYGPTFFATPEAADTNGILRMWLTDGAGNEQDVAFFNDNANGGRVAFDDLEGLEDGPATVSITYQAPDYDADVAPAGMADGGWAKYVVTVDAITDLTATQRFGTQNAVRIKNTEDTRGIASMKVGDHVAFAQNDTLKARFIIRDNGAPVRLFASRASNSESITLTGTLPNLTLTDGANIASTASYTVKTFTHNGETWHRVEIDATIDVADDYQLKAGPGDPVTDLEIELLKPQLFKNPVGTTITKSVIINRPDSVAPFIENPSSERPTPSTGLITFESTDDDGIAYVVLLPTNDNAPNVDQVIAGTNHLNEPAPAYSVAVSGQYVSIPTGTIDPATAYYPYIVHVDASGNKSNVLEGALLAVEPGASAKEIRFTVASNTHITRNGVAYTGTADWIKVYASDYRISEQTPLAVQTNVPIIAGEFILNEAGLDSGSVNALSTGVNYIVNIGKATFDGENALNIYGVRRVTEV